MAGVRKSAKNHDHRHYEEEEMWSISEQEIRLLFSNTTDVTPKYTNNAVQLLLRLMTTMSLAACDLKIPQIRARSMPELLESNNSQCQVNFLQTMTTTPLLVQLPLSLYSTIQVWKDFQQFFRHYFPIGWSIDWSSNKITIIKNNNTLRPH